MRSAYRFLPMCVAIALANCTTPPSLPHDASLPIKKILRQSICELRTAFADIQKQNKGQANPRFAADKWAVGITLTPKTDTETSLRAGLTGKSSSANSFFNSWQLGSGSGGQFDFKGHRDGSILYTVHSAQLLDEKNYPLDCNFDPAANHMLTSNFDIGGWLNRVADASESDLVKLTDLDKPSFNTQVVILFDGAGSFTYNFPLGTDLFGAYGKYSVDETLSILLTKDPGTSKDVVVTLPSGGQFGNKQTTKTIQIPTGVTPAAKDKLEGMQFEQLLRNLNSNVGRAR